MHAWRINSALHVISQSQHFSGYSSLSRALVIFLKDGWLSILEFHHCESRKLLHWSNFEKSENFAGAIKYKLLNTQNQWCTCFHSLQRFLKNMQDVDRHSDKHRLSGNKNGNNVPKHSLSEIFQLHIINTHTKHTHTHTQRICQKISLQCMYFGPFI